MNRKVFCVFLNALPLKNSFYRDVMKCQCVKSEFFPKIKLHQKFFFFIFLVFFLCVGSHFE